MIHCNDIYFERIQRRIRLQRKREKSKEITTNKKKEEKEEEEEEESNCRQGLSLRQYLDFSFGRKVFPSAFFKLPYSGQSGPSTQLSFFFVVLCNAFLFTSSRLDSLRDNRRSRTKRI